MGAFANTGAWPETLVRRAEILREIRRFFDDLGFVEVETAVRVDAPAPEPHIDCPPVATGGFLRASPELQMKKLLAAGMEKIYQIGPCFRDGERGTRHNPEFTMIEWYRRNATYRDIQEDLTALLGWLGEGQRSKVRGQRSEVKGQRSEVKGQRAEVKGQRAEVKGQRSEVKGQRSSTFNLQPLTLSIREAYLKYAGWDPWTAWDADRFDFDMATKIEPALKTLGMVFLTDYPTPAASLAKISTTPGARSVDAIVPIASRPPGARSVDAIVSIASRRGGVSGTDAFETNASTVSYAERWEFYWDGLELANCFTELCDEAEQRRRFAAAKEERKALGESDYPLDERFFAALPAMGSAAGVALGVDRLVMKLLGLNDIALVRAGV